MDRAECICRRFLLAGILATTAALLLAACLALAGRSAWARTITQVGIWTLIATPVVAMCLDAFLRRGGHLLRALTIVTILALAVASPLLWPHLLGSAK